MTHDSARSEQNPVLFATPAGQVWLLYTSQHGKDQDTAVVKRLVSRDGGGEWSVRVRNRTCYWGIRGRS